MVGVAGQRGFGQVQGQDRLAGGQLLRSPGRLRRRRPAGRPGRPSPPADRRGRARWWTGAGTSRRSSPRTCAPPRAPCRSPGRPAARAGSSISRISVSTSLPALMPSRVARWTWSTAPCSRAERGVDQVGPDDRVVAAGDQHLGRSARTVSHRGQVGLGEPVAVAPQRVEVREVGEQRPEEVADEGDAVLRAARRRRQSTVSPPGVEISSTLEVADGQRERGRRRGCRASAGPGPSARRGSRSSQAADDLGPSWPNQITAVREAEALDAQVVGLAGRVVRPGRRTGARLAEQPDAADVVDVGLRGDDVRRRARADGVEHALVVRGLEAHAGVDDRRGRRR